MADNGGRRSHGGANAAKQLRSEEKIEEKKELYLSSKAVSNEWMCSMLV